MTGQSLVEEIIARGGHLRLQGETLVASAPPELMSEVRNHKRELMCRLRRIEEVPQREKWARGFSDEELLAQLVIAPCEHRELPDEIYYPPGCDTDAEWARLTAGWEGPCVECDEAEATFEA